MELNREELEGLLGAYAIDALDPDERDELDQLIAHDAALADEVRRFQEVAMGLLAGMIDEQPAPADLRAGVLDRATAARAPGRHLANPTGADLAVLELWRRQWRELDVLLDDLSGADWAAVTSLGRTVRELLAHLSAVLDLYAVDLGAGTFELPDGTPIGHWEITEPRIADLTARPTADTVAQLRATAARLDERLASFAPSQLDDLVEGGVLTIADRTRHQSFELWMHTDDVRRSSKRAMVDPDAERVCALSDLSARFVGLGMLVSGRDHRGGHGRLVLTGPGGGTWVIPLGFDEANGAALPGLDQTSQVTIVADAVAYCRMAGKLLGVDELAFEVDGDGSLALDLFVGAQAFTE